MQIMLEVRKGLSIQRDHVTAVRKENDKSSRIYTAGGEFVVDQSYNVVLDQLHAPEADVMEAARNLIDILDHAAPYMNEISEAAAAAKHPYQGPNFKNEIEDLRIALRQAE